MVTAGRTQQRIQRSRDALIAAAWDLAQARPWSEVTVSDICDAADVAPRTFYRYFPDKVELLFADAAEHESGIAAAVADLAGVGPVAFIGALFDALVPGIEGYGREGMRRRVELIDADPELTARDQLKQLRIRALAATRLRNRGGLDAATATTWAAVCMTLFQDGIRRWTAGSRSLREHLDEALSAASPLLRQATDA